MSDRLKLRLALAVLVIAGVCLMRCELWAQPVTFPLSLSVGDFGQYGYESPYTEIGAGIEHRSRHAIFEGRLTYSPTHKNTVSDGYSLGGNAALSLRARPLFIGAGISQTHVSNSQWSKTATRSSLIAGLDTDTWRLAVSRELPGHDPNALEGWTYTARLNLTPRFRLGATYYASRYSLRPGDPDKVSANGVGVSVEWVMGAKR